MAVTKGVINLSKGTKINLSKELALTNIMVGLGWDANEMPGGPDFDLDASAFLVGKNGITIQDGFVFYSNLRGPNDCVVHMGDNLDGNGNGEDQDDEQIMIDLSKVPDSVDKIAIAVSIYEAEARHENFGMVHNSYCRLVNMDSKREVARFDLGEDFSIETAVVVGEVYRYQGEWKFNAIGRGMKGGLVSVCSSYGLAAEYR